MIVSYLQNLWMEVLHYDLHLGLNKLLCRRVLAEPSAEQVRAFLRSHSDFLERFIMEEVELEVLERWMIRSMQRAKKRPDATSTGMYSNCPSFATACLK